MCKKSALPVVWVSLVRVANVVSRVCLDPLALPARKACRVNLVRTGWTVLKVSRESPARRVNLVRLVPPALRANVVSRVCLDPLALPARKARRANLVRTGWTGVIMTIPGLSAV